MKKFLSILLCVCLIATTVITVPMVSAQEKETTEYFYHFNDYESLTNDEEWLSFATQNVAMSVENGDNVIGGSQSLKVNSDVIEWVGVALSNVNVPEGVNARVSFDYKVTAGTKGWGHTGYIGFSENLNTNGEKLNCFNWATLNNGSYTENAMPIYERAASAAVVAVKGTMARKDKGNYPVGIYWNSKKAASEVIFDNLTVAQIINTVAAVSSDETRGTVSVANKDATLTDYAMYETAVFTATPNEGYGFKGWYDNGVLVSEDAVYEHTLTGDTTLTAKWGLYEGDYDYIECDYENLTDCEEWFSKADSHIASIETENPISGSASLKLTKDAKGYGGISVFPYGTNLKSGKNYRVKIDAAVQSGKIGFARLGNIGFKADNSFNWAHIYIYGGYTGNPDNGGTPVNLWAWVDKTPASGVIRTKGTLKMSESKQYSHLGFAFNVSDVDATLGEASILLDNAVAAEIIETVSAISSDETRGSVSVANKEGYEDYAKNEVAVFTATPNEGYSFAGWYNDAGELVSEEATYEHTLTTDTTLTAKWKFFEKEYDYLAYDYENMSDYDEWFATARDSVMSLETENPLSGSASLKLTANKPGYLSASVIPINVSLKYATTYRMTATAKVTAGVFNLGRIGSASITSDGTVNPWNIGTGATTTGCIPFDLLKSWGKHSSTMAVTTVTNKLTTATAGLKVLGSIFSVDSVDGNSTASILIDDIIAAEIIDSVSATSADATMGSATVVNKAGYEDYAKNEVAVFTATPSKGYYLEGWYNINGEKVSDQKVYEVTLNTDTDLTANFAPYDKFSTISFNTNGADEIDSISDGAGATIVFPENPTKDGYTFAGWYTDANCTDRFAAKTFPAEDTTLYAKWIVGSYQDFENYTATTSPNVQILTDGENSFAGNGYAKFLSSSNPTGQFVVSSTEAIKDFALPKDKIQLSFKYKMVSGAAHVYLHTSATPDRSSLTKIGKNSNGIDVYLNAYKYKRVDLALSEDWQSVTATFDLRSIAEAMDEYNKLAETTVDGITIGDYLYSVIYILAEGATEIYIDDISLSLVPGEFIKTAYNNAAALRSAEASTTGKNGLRIYNEIDAYWVEAKNIVEFGSVAAFDSNIDGEITIENGKKGIAYSDGTLSDETLTLWETKVDTVVYTSYLTNIVPSRYDDDILVRSYAIAADGTVYYGQTVAVSVYDVANAIDNANTVDGSETTKADADAFYSFVTAKNKDTYKLWCEQNNKNLGTLFNSLYA